MIKVDNSIWASKTLGLCNDNDGSSDADGWLPRDSDTSTSDLQAFISSWKEDPNCANPPPINNYCVSFMISMSARFT